MWVANVPLRSDNVVMVKVLSLPEDVPVAYHQIAPEI